MSATLVERKLRAHFDRLYAKTLAERRLAPVLKPKAEAKRARRAAKRRKAATN